jgi:two-component system sensor histidine kinase YesM
LKKLNLTRRVRTDWNNLRIRQRMLVSYILAILIPIVFINALTFVLTRNMALVTVSKAVDVTLANGNNTFNALFTGLYERAVATSNTRELASLFDETEVAPVSGSVPTLRLSETLSALSVIYETSPQYFYKFYAERENLSYYSGNLQIVNSFPANLQEWYKKAIRFGDGVYWWDVHDDESFGFSRRFITACRTINSKDGEALGLATVSLDFMRVGEAFINLMKPYQGMVYIFDSTGRPLFANRIDNKIAPLATLPADPLSDEIKTAAFSSAYGNGRIGSQVIFNYANVDQLMWKIVTVLPQDQFFGVTNTFWSFLVPVLLATILIFLIVTLRVSSNLSRPIEVLAASMLSADETAFPRSYLEREDEIGALTRAYIRMVDRNAQLIDETKLINEKKRLFQLEALQRQIDSHFIHNTLNNIQWLATAGRNDDVISTATSLGRT